ncbi:hypothetical protein MUK42_28245 [Musa troglodytarum]|uniref:Uncharacterized protein n=1 Tax=Musa troglodytarum TaxID=320322 RepID=A0A9E7F250_9LILI|nr:hypothetical protein MUK42_28245 [Musa troglodytarum]
MVKLQFQNLGSLTKEASGFVGKQQDCLKAEASILASVPLIHHQDKLHSDVLSNRGRTKVHGVGM